MKAITLHLDPAVVLFTNALRTLPKKVWNRFCPTLFFVWPAN